MPADLYDILEVERDATPEQIRRAYKKKALKTHPDRLPPGSTEVDKAHAEEQFRKVNNAYEVLNDPQNRRVYDLHGVWPPPRPGQTPESPRYGDPRRASRRAPGFFDDQFSDPFFSRRPFMFTDPNELFESVFGPPPFPHSRHGGHHRHPRHQSYIPQSPFEQLNQMANMMSSMHRDMMPNFGGFGGQDFFSEGFGQPSGSGTRRWERRSVSQTINGVQQSVTETIDWEGNTHVTRTFPDGRKVHTINGVEQPSQGYLPPQGTVQEQAGNRHLPPPPPYSSGSIPPEPEHTRHSRRHRTRSEAYPSRSETYRTGHCEPAPFQPDPTDMTRHESRSRWKPNWW